MDEITINGTTLKLVQGNIVEQQVEAIINAANSHLAGGGGVDGAIHRAAGWHELQALTKPLGSCPTGSAVITTAAKIPPPIKYIIHAVGPVYHDGTHGEPELLAGAYQRSLKLADEKGLHSLAFPAISTGVYGYPKEAAASVALSTVISYIHVHDGQNQPATNLRLILFVLFDVGSLRTYQRQLQKLFKTS